MVNTTIWRALPRHNRDHHLLVVPTHMNVWHHKPLPTIIHQITHQTHHQTINRNIVSSGADKPSQIFAELQPQESADETVRGSFQPWIRQPQFGLHTIRERHLGLKEAQVRGTIRTTITPWPWLWSWPWMTIINYCHDRTTPPRITVLITKLQLHRAGPAGPRDFWSSCEVQTTGLWHAGGSEGDQKQTGLHQPGGGGNTNIGNGVYHHRDDRDKPIFTSRLWPIMTIKNIAFSPPSNTHPFSWTNNTTKKTSTTWFAWWNASRFVPTCVWFSSSWASIFTSSWNRTSSEGYPRTWSGCSPFRYWMHCQCWLKPI